MALLRVPLDGSEGALHVVDIVLKCQPVSRKAIFHYVQGAVGPLLSPVMSPPSQEPEPLYYYLLGRVNR